MKIKKGQLVLLLITVLQSAAIFIANAQTTKTPNGILVKIGGQQIGLSTTNDAAFCLSINNVDRTIRH